MVAVKIPPSGKQYFYFGTLCPEVPLSFLPVTFLLLLEWLWKTAPGGLLVIRHLLPDRNRRKGEHPVLFGYIRFPVVDLLEAVAGTDHVAAIDIPAIFIDPRIPPIGFKIEVGQNGLRHVQHFHILHIDMSQRFIVGDAAVEIVAADVMDKIDEVAHAGRVLARADGGAENIQLAFIQLREQVGKMVQLVDVRLFTKALRKAGNI